MRIPVQDALAMSGAPCADVSYLSCRDTVPPAHVIGGQLSRSSGYPLDRCHHLSLKAVQICTGFKVWWPSRIPVVQDGHHRPFQQSHPVFHAELGSCSCTAVGEKGAPHFVTGVVEASVDIAIVLQNVPQHKELGAKTPQGAGRLFVQTPRHKA